eukprot:5025868-Amphidinium_carterae.1
MLRASSLQTRVCPTRPDQSQVMGRSVHQLNCLWVNHRAFTGLLALTSRVTGIKSVKLSDSLAFYSQ